MKVLCVLGFVLLLMLKIVLLPVRALLGLLSNKAFLEGLIFAVLIAVIPRALYILGGSLIAGIQGLLRRI